MIFFQALVATSDEIGPSELGAVVIALPDRALDGALTDRVAVGPVEAAAVAAVQRAPVVEAAAPFVVAVPVEAAGGCQELITDVLHASVGAIGELPDFVELAPFVEVTVLVDALGVPPLELEPVPLPVPQGARVVVVDAGAAASAAAAGGTARARYGLLRWLPSGLASAPTATGARLLGRFLRRLLCAPAGARFPVCGFLGWLLCLPTATGARCGLFRGLGCLFLFIIATLLLLLVFVLLLALFIVLVLLLLALFILALALVLLLFLFLFLLFRTLSILDIFFVFFC